MRVALWGAFFLIVVVSIAHSYLGERYILIRLFRREDLPRLRGSDHFTKQTLRFAWHITSVAWLGLGAVLLALLVPQNRAMIAMLVSGTFLLHALVTGVASRGRHYAWIIFLAIAGLSAYAASLM
jgi:hypothetical protein